MSEPHPTNRDPKDQRDPAHPPPEHEAQDTVEDDQDAEPTMNATGDERPDGMHDPSAGDEDGAARE